jgi:hypothetical protein
MTPAAIRRITAFDKDRAAGTRPYTAVNAPRTFARALNTARRREASYSLPHSGHRPRTDNPASEYEHDSQVV